MSKTNDIISHHDFDEFFNSDSSIIDNLVNSLQKENLDRILFSEAKGNLLDTISKYFWKEDIHLYIANAGNDRKSTINLKSVNDINKFIIDIKERRGNNLGIYDIALLYKEFTPENVFENKSKFVKIEDIEYFICPIEKGVLANKASDLMNGWSKAIENSNENKKKIIGIQLRTNF